MQKLHNNNNTYEQHWKTATTIKMIRGHYTYNYHIIQIYSINHAFAKRCIKYSLPKYNKQHLHWSDR